jgi:hypothetical protein
VFFTQCSHINRWRWVKDGKILSPGAPGSWDEGGVSVRHMLKIGD